MRRTTARIATIALLLLASTAPVLADPPGLKTLAIGSPAPDFRLPGVDGKNHALADFAGAKVLVVAFTCNHCPTAQAYEARLAKLRADYLDRGVALVVISPNDPAAIRLDELGYSDLGDSFDDMKIRAKDRGFAFPYLYDGETQETSRAYGVLATPQIYVFDAERTLRYVGRFDDSEVKEVKSHDAINAIEDLLAGREVARPTTRIVGCSTKWSDKREDAVKSIAKWDAELVSLEPIDEAGVAKLVRNEGKTLLLVNVWATWCGPCVAELPDFVATNRMYRGRDFKMVTISTDDPAKRDDALKVLREHHASSANYIMKAEDRDKFAEALDKEWPGPVPYTMLVAPGGKVVYRKGGAVDPLEVRRAIVDQLGRTYANRK